MNCPHPGWRRSGARQELYRKNSKIPGRQKAESPGGFAGQFL